MGETRLGFRWTPRRVMGTFDLTGGDLHVMDTLGSDGMEIGGLSTTGQHFLWHRSQIVDGKARVFSMFSDGVQPGKRLVEPPPGSDDGELYNADTHLAWLRGSGQQKPNVYDHVELWATKFTGDPTTLEPYKVSELPGRQDILSSVTGGWGHYALYTWIDKPSGLYAIDIWNLETKTHWMAEANANKNLLSFIGTTKTHVWTFMSGPQAQLNEELVRFPLDGPPSN
jgi:hypothetical protein